MAQLIASYGGTGTTFKSQVVGDVVAATREAIAEFDTLAMRAVGAASRWMATMGASNTAEMILSRCAAR